MIASFSKRQTPKTPLFAPDQIGCRFPHRSISIATFLGYPAGRFITSPCAPCFVSGDQLEKLRIA
jgi:hypothetical protein